MNIIYERCISLADAMADAVESVMRAHATERDPATVGIPYADYLRTRHWRLLRRRMLARAGYRCRQCGTGGTRLDVHHLNYDHLGQETDQDLQVLCFQCHAAEHGK